MDEQLDVTGVDPDANDDAEWGRLAPPRNPSQVYSIRIPVERLEQLRRIAERSGLAPSVLMRRWVIERLDRDRAGARASSVRVNGENTEDVRDEIAHWPTYSFAGAA
jgi:hypothetical protein